MGLATRTLGWAGDDRDREFFRWKHWDNPFGESPGWAAFDGDRMVAFRTFMRWEMRRGGETLKLVRAVDTATDPEYQGRGLFRALTMRGVEELTDEGVDAVFNTPNRQSMPGYLKMGWKILGRPTLWVRPRSASKIARLVGRRVPAEKWSLPLELGTAAHSFAGAQGAMRESWCTPKARDVVAWRYGFEPLRYRHLVLEGGSAVVRLRRRGRARELCVCERSGGAGFSGLVSAVGPAADYALGVGLSWSSEGFPLPRQGPVVTWRPLRERTVPVWNELHWTLGDLELF